MNRAARTVQSIVQKIEYTASRVLVLVAERHLNLLGMPSFEVLAILRVQEEIGLAHIEVKVDGIKRHQSREQCRRTRDCAAAGDQVAYRNKMCSHASCERRRNPAMVEVELCIANPGFRLFDGCPRRSLIGYALVNVFDRSGIVL